MNKFIGSVLSFIGGIILIYAGFKLFINKEQLEILTSKPIEIHFYACLLTIPMYLLSGISSFILYKSVSKTTISLYDVVTLPFVISMWGFLIPFQGSYIYNSIYFKAKYHITIVNTTSIYLLSVSISLIIAGILGIIYNCFFKQNSIFLILSIASLIHPVFIFLSLYLLKKNKNTNQNFIGKMKNKIEIIFTDYMAALNGKNLSLLSIISLLDTLFYAAWSLWICKNLGFDLSFFQLLLLASFVKLTLLVKLTPGNMGINQFASSGIILLAGGTIAEGFTLSLYQTAIFIITSFLLGSVFSVMNMKYFFKK
ncbi:MAG: flippase-like domain-containing protein [Bacteroidetes bacterium]|nr:flippase-like domain-containing protein [Bacteroidota bacterium]